MRVHEHPLESRTVRKLLEDTLPQSLPTLRRLSFPHPPGKSLKLFATFPPDSDETPKAFSVALFDDFNSGRREASIFSSLELNDAFNEVGETTLSKSTKAASEESLYALIAFVAALCNAAPRSQPLEGANEGASPKSVLLLTCLSSNNFESLRSAAQRLCSSSENSRLILRNPATIPGYMKYVVHRQALFSSHAPSLPESLYFDQVRSDDDYAYVVANNDIASKWGRSLLDGLYNIGIRLGRSSIPSSGRKEGDLVAFGFIGFDGGFRTFYTDPSFRRQGLSKVILFKLAEVMQSIWEKPIEWYHADVGDDNTASRGLFESVGATRGWYVHWIQLDADVAALL